MKPGSSDRRYSGHSGCGVGIVERAHFLNVNSADSKINGERTLIISCGSLEKGIANYLDDVDKTKKILQQVGIDTIYGNQNLVWAPLWSNHTNSKAAPVKPRDNPGKSYAKSVFDRINGEYNNGVGGIDAAKSRVKEELRKIAIDFIGGSW